MTGAKFVAMEEDVPALTAELRFPRLRRIA